MANQCWKSGQPGQASQASGESDPALRAAMARRLHGRAIVSGSIVLPAVPGMIDDYMVMCLNTFSAIGASFNEEQHTKLHSVLEGQLAIAFAASPRYEIVITYNSPVGLMVNYHVKAQWTSIEASYDNWISTREPPLFWSEPDAKALALASATTDPASFPILDIGAGTGRNEIPLAKRGHPVDALEMAPKFADVIRQEAQNECLNIRVIERDVFSGADDLRRNYRLILLSEVVSDFHSTDQLRGLFGLAAQCLAPGGQLVFNAFVAKDSFIPTHAARELGLQCYSSIFTRSEIATAVELQPLTLESDDSVYAYEKAHLPAEAWPPTSWYEGWVSGQDVFGVGREDSPIELRWLVYRKKS